MRPREGDNWSVARASSALSLFICAVAWFALTIAVAPRGVWAQANSSAPADLSALEQAFQAVVTRVSPSVVGIRAHRRQFARWTASAGEIGPVEQEVIINGSGTVIQADGLILTNEHVVRGATDIEVRSHNRRTYRGTVVATDARSDLAVVQIDAAGLTPARMCEWNHVARGQWSIALGNPFGLGSDGNLSVSVGVIANLGRSLPGLGEVDDRLYDNMIQTTAPIHPGNSGGPLFNIRGELVGVITAVHTRGVDDEGVGFAIPMTPAKRRIVYELALGRSVKYGYLGLTARELTVADRQSADAGVLVEAVEPGGPAAQGGIKAGDVITRFDAQPVRSPMSLASYVGQTPVGQTVQLGLLRHGRPITLEAVIDTREVARVSWLRIGAIHWRGMRLTNLTMQVRERMGIDAGVAGIVVIDVALDSPAARARIQAGDVIERVAETAVSEVTAFRQRVRSEKGAVSVRVRERGDVSVSP